MMWNTKYTKPTKKKETRTIHKKYTTTHIKNMRINTHTPRICTPTYTMLLSSWNIKYWFKKKKKKKVQFTNWSEK